MAETQSGFEILKYRADLVGDDRLGLNTCIKRRVITIVQSVSILRKSK